MPRLGVVQRLLQQASRRRRRMFVRHVCQFGWILLLFWTTCRNFALLHPLPTIQHLPDLLPLDILNSKKKSLGKQDRNEKLYKWESSGINIHNLLLFINDTFTGQYEKHVDEHDQKYGAFPAFLANVESVGIRIWVPRSIMARRDRFTIGRRLGLMMKPLFAEALDILSVSTGNYPDLAKVLQTTGILPMALQLDDFTGCAKDNYRRNDTNNTTVPIFAFCEEVNCPNTLSIPTYSMLTYAKFNTSEEWVSQFETWQQEYPWETKIPKLFWRGSCRSQYPWLLDGEGVRTRIVNASVLDENVRQWVDILPVKKNCKFQNITIYTNETPPEWSMKYRAVLDMDGNSWSERFVRLLCYNSVVVKMEPKYVDYLWSTLEPWVHYIPVTEASFANISKFVAADQNQPLLQNMVRQANAWCSRHMTIPQIRNDFLHILNGYVQELNRHDDASWLKYHWKTKYKTYIQWEGENDFFSEHRFHDRAQKAVSIQLNPIPLFLNDESDNGTK